MNKKVIVLIVILSFTSILYLCYASPFGATRGGEGPHFFVRPITLEIIKVINTRRASDNIATLREMLSLTELARQYCILVADGNKLSHRYATEQEKTEVLLDLLDRTDEIELRPRIYSYYELLAVTTDNEAVAQNTITILDKSPSHSMGLWNTNAKYIGVYCIPKDGLVYTTIYIGTIKEK